VKRCISGRSATTGSWSRAITWPSSWGDDTLRLSGSQTVDIGGDERTHVAGDRVDRMDRNQTTFVAGDRLDTVRGNSSGEVDGDRTTTIGGQDRLEVGGRSEAAFGDDHTVRVRGCETRVIGTSDARRSYTVFVQGEMELTSTDAAEIASDEALVLRCGQSSIRLGPTSIEILSPSITVSTGGTAISLSDQAAKLRTEGKAQIIADRIVLKSSGASLGMTSEVKVDGAKILLNSPSSATDPVDDDPVKPTKIELVDAQGKPLANQRFLVTLADGSERSGMLDHEGKAEIDIDGAAEIEFPDLDKVRPA
jgi:hypothetical protein